MNASRRLYFLLLLIAGLPGFPFIVGMMREHFRTPPPACQVEISVSVSVDGRSVPVEFPVTKPIKVEGGAEVIVTAEVEPKPKGCAGNILLEWSLPFVPDSPQLQVAAKAAHESLRVTLIDTQVPTEYPDQIIRTILHVSSDQNKVQKILTFEVRGK